MMLPFPSPSRFDGLLAVAAVAILGAPACQRQAAAPPPPRPVSVEAFEVVPRAVELPYEYPGRLEGSRQVEVRARVSGILLERAFAEGRPVHRGQTLFLIDPAPYAAEVAAREAALAEAAASLAQAERERARIEPLTAAKAVSQRDADAALAAVEQGRAKVQAAEAALERAKLDLAYTHVDAPIGGLTSRSQLSEGSLVGPGALLTQLSQVQPIWVRFAVSDEELLALRRAVEERRLDAPPEGERRVELVLADGSVRGETGRVNFADSVIDPETGSIELRAELPNADGTLVPGQFVRVRLLGIERPAAILVPQRAVQQGQGGKMVFVVGEDGTAQARPVEVGPWIGDDWLIEEGLAAGDRVIVDGLVRVRPGAAVEVAPPASDAPPPAPAP